MRIRRTLSALLLLAAAGCHDDALSATSTALTGDWGPTTSLVGSRWTMHLDERGPSLTGTGEYALEAGRSGTLAVTGIVAGEQVTLDIAYDYGLKEHFVGVHTNLDVLHGTSTRVFGADTTTTETDFYRRGTL
jgi:hypothetical protein